MSDDRKPVWPWIVTLLVGLLVMYVASFGPAYSLWWRVPLSRTVGRGILAFYSPLFRLRSDFAFVDTVISRYAHVWGVYSTLSVNMEWMARSCCGRRERRWWARFLDHR